MNTIDQLDTQVKMNKELFQKARNNAIQAMTQNDFEQAKHAIKAAEGFRAEATRLTKEYMKELDTLKTHCYSVENANGEGVRTTACIPTMEKLVKLSNKFTALGHGLVSGYTLITLEVGQSKPLADVLGFPTGFTVTRLN